MKRAMDMAVSSLCLVLLFPVLVVIAALIALDSSGGILYLQTRVGLDGRYFHVLKFRSMYTDRDSTLDSLQARKEAESLGRILKMKNDPRITRVGRFLRSTSIDEFPQLINVFLGDMSIVGPRPLIPSMLQPYPEWARARQVMRPGITGLWQISAREHNESLADMIEYDLDYINNWSLWKDTSIVLRTPRAVISRRGAI